MSSSNGFVGFKGDPYISRGYTMLTTLSASSLNAVRAHTSRGFFKRRFHETL